MTQYALIENSSVINTIVWDGVSPYIPPTGFEIIAIPSGTVVSPGYTYASGIFTAPATQPAAPPTLAQQAAVAINNGLNIISSSNPGLNGLYATNSTAQSNILATQVYIQNNGKFPGSSSTLLWLDQTNSPHTFTTTGQFTEFATAIADYVSDLTLISLTGSGSLPATTTTIA